VSASYSSNLGASSSRSQSHLDSEQKATYRPCLQRQGTFTETRRSRPHSAEFSDYSGQCTATRMTNRPLSGPPQAKVLHKRVETKKTSSNFSDQNTVAVSSQSSSRYGRQISDTPNSSRPASNSNRPHSHCFTRTSPSPTFARKYRGSPNRGRMI